MYSEACIFSPTGMLKMMYIYIYIYDSQVEGE